MNTSEEIDEGNGCPDHPSVSIESVQSLPDRYFFYENEEYSHVLTIVDEDTIMYGSHDPNKRKEYFIVASKSERRFLSVVYVNEDGNAVPVELDQDRVEILDIGGFGERWEGPTLRNGPFGWGIRFDDDGELVYEGFSVFGKYSLFGTEYNPGLHIVLYEGTWCDGRRCGKGRQFGRHGSLLCKGEWVNDSYVKDNTCFVPASPDLPFIGSHIVTLVVGKNSCGSNSSLVLRSFPRLKQLWIGEESFGKKSKEEMVFSCVNCPELVAIFLEEKTMQFFSRVIITGESEYTK